MRIERTTDISEVLKCVPFEQEIRNKGRDRTRISKMILLIKDQLENPLFGYFIAYDGDRVVGYAIGTLVLESGFEQGVLWRMYAKTKELREALTDTLIKWAKEYKIKKVTMSVYTDGMAKVMERRYSWKKSAIILERSI